MAGCASTSTSTPAPPATSTVTVTASPPASASATATPTATAAAQPYCAAGQLRLTLSSPNGYAGGVYQDIVFTNTSGSVCRLYGYPGVSLVSGPPYKQIGLAAKRTTAPAPASVTLTSGGTAHAVLQVVDALNYPAASCDPATASRLRVYPPDLTTAFYLSSAAQGCAKPVQVLSVSPVQPGSS